MLDPTALTAILGMDVWGKENTVRMDVCMLMPAFKNY